MLILHLHTRMHQSLLCIAGLSVRNALAWRVLSGAYMQAASDLLPAAVLDVLLLLLQQDPCALLVQ